MTCLACAIINNSISFSLFSLFFWFKINRHLNGFMTVRSFPDFLTSLISIPHFHCEKASQIFYIIFLFCKLIIKYVKLTCNFNNKFAYFLYKMNKI